MVGVFSRRFLVGPIPAKLVGAVLATALLSAAPAAAAEYTLAKDASVGFRVGFIFGTVVGEFRRFTGRATFAGGTLTGVRAEIACASIDTQRQRRDDHLRSEHFFWCDRHATLRFASTSVRRSGAGGYRIVGDLTMRGATHPVELSGTLVPQGAGYRFAAKAVVDRQKWGITWNKSRGGRDLFINDKVTLQFSGALSPAR